MASVPLTWPVLYLQLIQDDNNQPNEPKIAVVSNLKYKSFRKLAGKARPRCRFRAVKVHRNLLLNRTWQFCSSDQIHLLQTHSLNPPEGLFLILSVMNISLEAHPAVWLCTLLPFRSPWAGLGAWMSPSLAPSAGQWS